MSVAAVNELFDFRVRMELFAVEETADSTLPATITKVSCTRSPLPSGRGSRALWSGSS